MGTGSVSGFGGLATGGRRYPLGALTEQLDSYWNQVCVCVCVEYLKWEVFVVVLVVFFLLLLFFLGPLVDSEGLDGESKQADGSCVDVTHSEHNNNIVEANI